MCNIGIGKGTHVSDCLLTCRGGHSTTGTVWFPVPRRLAMHRFPRSCCGMLSVAGLPKPSLRRRIITVVFILLLCALDLIVASSNLTGTEVEGWAAVFAGLSGIASSNSSLVRRKALQQNVSQRPTPNLATGAVVRMSSTAAGTSRAAAVNGDTWGSFETMESHAATNPEISPWIEVDLGRTMQVSAVEVWLPYRMCEHYLKRIDPRQKAQIDKMLKMKQRPVHFCNGGWPSFEPTADRPLELQLLGASEAEVVASTAFPRRMSVYSWNDLDASARVLRIATSPGTVTALHVAQVKIYGLRGSQDCTHGTCGHGACSKTGTCVCPPTHVGPRCEYNIQGVDYFLPHDVQHGWWDDHRFLSYQSLMSGLQSNCQNPKTMRKHAILPGTGGMGAGFGSTMYFRTGIMTEAANMRSAYLYFGKFNYALNDYCRQMGEYGTFECYFEPMTSCPEVTASLRATYSFPAANAKGPRGEDCLVPNKKGQVSAGCNAGPEYFSVPKAFAKHGLFWWRMLQIAHLIRPNANTLKLLDLPNLKSKIGYEHPIIGVHMRSGDGCRYGVRARLFDCRRLADYLPDIRTLSQKYGTKRVFLSTDDAAAIQDSQQLEEFEWVIVPTDRSTFTSNVKIEQRLVGVGAVDKLDQHVAMLSTLQDLFLLAEADYLVTHQASTMSRVALQLGALFHKHIPPFISMDGPWCPHWRMCCSPNHITGDSIEC